MKTSNHATHCTLITASQKNTVGLLTLIALFLCSFAVSTSAQNPVVSKIVPEKSFTIAPNVQTPIVLKTKPDAACDLHAVGTSDSRSMRFYANGDGYVKIHANAREGMEGRVQLDCSSKGQIVRYPLHLLASLTPTAEMPVPRSRIPIPKGSKVRPALTEARAQSLTDDQLEKLGYPARPDVLGSPDMYATWLDRVSGPMTLLPTHLVSRSDIRSAPVAYTSSNWSGLEAHRKFKHTYSAVGGSWNVPVIVVASSDGNTDYSSFWVGLDGDGTNDLVQAGTEQDAQEIGGIVYANYFAWSELLPNQPTEQEVGSVNPGDEIEVEVWIGTGSGAPNPNGSLSSYRITNVTQGLEARFDIPLNGTFYHGTEAEWIMERPTVNGSLPELSAYLIANMANANALQVKGTKWVFCGTAANRNITMYNGKDVLSEAAWLGKGSNSIIFQWFNFK